MNTTKTHITTIILVFCIISTVMSAELGAPEDTVVNFTEAYKKLDWGKAAKYLHPIMINDIRVKTIAIIKRVRKSDVRDVLSSFGVGTLAELENMPPEQFYVINQNRWIKDARPNFEPWKNAKYEVINSKLISADEYLIDLRCTLTAGSEVKERLSVYTVKLVENEWKIIKLIHRIN